ncbi:CubicO group peptidase (beta-lactamase class C family) [Pedobacter psychrotolerans]|uniref:CubicO group peptidase (Beta-lactamase class C family) n=1 Tax=Pedobacter psychrotolerans TaxID=1843235 RepID=A0A4R2H437_9SPHI|nr:serine hydrolase domain-containing protein [Pedobacter psychrotolerans]TCO19956.1 CubicO group peptidase (beta-lactamase class C family) [Pedobacter psychrotolerans]GGE50072.1 serine hydrolase [Pedobacter psychrotolerans]
MRSKINIITLLLCITIGATAYGQQTEQLHLKSTNAIDSTILEKMNDAKLVGLGAAIIVDKKLVWSKGYGYADRENKVPFTTSTVMNIASISKTITGACLMKAVEQGKLSLDEDINTYLPFKIYNPFFPKEKITLRNLATHTSGLSDRFPFYTSDTLYVNGKDSEEALGDFLQNYFTPGGKYYSKENFLDHKPGTFREYSNLGTALAGYIVEVQTGKKLNDYSRKYLFKPLKMDDTGWFLSEINLKKHARLYQKQADSSIKLIPLYGQTTYPDGGVRTSVNDLSHFFICLLNGGKFQNRQVLREKTVQEMLRFQFDDAHKPENIEPDKLNSGIFWSTKMGGKRIGHNGSDFGVRTFMLSDLKKEVAVIMFINTSLLETEEAKFFGIYNELYQYGVQMRNSNHASSTGN